MSFTPSQLFLDELKRNLKNLKIKDRNFYHVYTFKQKDYSLIFLDDFLNVLESLMKLEVCNNSNKQFNHTKFMLFLRIFDVFEQIINRIFIPMEVKITLQEPLFNRSIFLTPSYLE